MKVALEIATARPEMTGVGTYASLLAEALCQSGAFDWQLHSPDPQRAQVEHPARSRVAPGRR